MRVALEARKSTQRPDIKGMRQCDALGAMRDRAIHAATICHGLANESKPGEIGYIPSLTNLSASAFTLCPC